MLIFHWDADRIQLHHRNSWTTILYAWRFDKDLVLMKFDDVTTKISISNWCYWKEIRIPMLMMMRRRMSPNGDLFFRFPFDAERISFLVWLRHLLFHRRIDPWWHRWKMDRCFRVHSHLFSVVFSIDRWNEVVITKDAKQINNSNDWSSNERYLPSKFSLNIDNQQIILPY